MVVVVMVIGFHVHWQHLFFSPFLFFPSQREREKGKTEKRKKKENHVLFFVLFFLFFIFFGDLLGFMVSGASFTLELARD